MTRIFLIAVFVGIFVGSSSGWKCENRGNETHLKIQNCDSDSWKTLRNLDVGKIVQIRAEYGKNNTFPTIDADLSKDMINLAELKLTYCQVENITMDAFSNLKSLNILNLRGNKILNLNKILFQNLKNFVRCRLPPTNRQRERQQ
jgi:hypothetical protein